MSALWVAKERAIRVSVAAVIATLTVWTSALQAQKALPFPAAAGDVSPPAAIAGLVDARPVAPLEFSRAWLNKVDLVRQKRAELIAENALNGLSPADAAKLGAALHGVLRVPIIPVHYTDVAEPFATEVLAQRLFGHATGDTLSYSDYYNEVSDGLLQVEGAVAPWVQLAHEARYYLPESQYGWAQFGKTAELRVEAIKAADHDVDFSQFDNDGPDGIPNSGDDDGFVDFIAIVYALPCQTDVRAGAIWPHRAAMAPIETNDNAKNGGKIKIADYVILPAVDPQTCGPMHVGVLAHETGHALGLPDLYDYDGSSQGIGAWGLMGTGSHSTRFSPAHLSAWEKEQLGWVKVNWLSTSTPPMAAPPVEKDPVIFRYDDPSGDGEYMLFENRQHVGSDKYIPGRGILAWRIDPERAELGAWNSDEHHPAVELVGGRPMSAATANQLVHFHPNAFTPERTLVNMTAVTNQVAETHRIAIHSDNVTSAWSAKGSQAWLTTVKSSKDTLSLTADPLGLPPGEYFDTVRITNARGDVSSRVAVDLRIAMPGMPEIIATALPWSWGLAAQSGFLLQASYGWDALGLRPRPRVLELWDGISRPTTLARIPADALYAPVIVDQNTSYVLARARDVNYLYRLSSHGGAEVVAANFGDGPAYGAALMPDGNLIVAQWNGKLHRITPAGQVSSYGKLNAHLYQIATDRFGNLYAATFDGTVIRMTPTGGSEVITTGFEKGKLVAIATTPNGELYVSERGGQGRIMRIDPDGRREIVLQRRGAQFYGVAVDDHFLYATDLRNRELLRIPRDGATLQPTFAQGIF